MNYQILQTPLVLIFLLQTAGSDPELSGGEGGGGSLRGSGLNQTNSMSFFLPLSTYTLKILGLGEVVCGGPDLLISAGSILVQYAFYPLQNSNSTLHKFSRLYKKPTTCKQCPKHGEKKRKENVYGCVKCNKHFCSFICQETLSCSS